MTGLIQFLTKIQTFNLHIVTKSELKSSIKKRGRNQLIALRTKHITMIHLLIKVRSGY